MASQRLVWMNGGNPREDLTVWQCRYSGIEVPDALWRYEEFGAGKPYSLNQSEHMVEDERVMAGFDAWTDAFAAAVRGKGKVPPGEFRAYGYQRPSHRIADLKLKWREARIRAGMPRAGSSPARQQQLDIDG